jgi:hypothetical protein
MGGPEFVAFLALLGAITGITAIIARAVVRYQERRTRGHDEAQDAAIRAELEEIRAVLADQPDLRQRLTDLEERLDFAERLLVQRQEQARLPEGR